MKGNKGYWTFSGRASVQVRLSDAEMEYVSNYFHPLIEEFKKKCISKNPDKKYNYLIDVYSRWRQNNFYLCQEFKAEFPDRIQDEFELKFVRLTCTGKDQFTFFYLRHTGKWHLVADGLSLEVCKEMIMSNPVFQPVG